MSKPLVLVIDDEKPVADSFAMLLNATGYSATAAYSGETGIALAKAISFDFLFTDVVMKPLNGIDAAEEICRILPNCRVFLVSGNNDTAALLQQASARGMDFVCLPKPVHPTVLLDTLRAGTGAQDA